MIDTSKHIVTLPVDEYLKLMKFQDIKDFKELTKGEPYYEELTKFFSQRGHTVNSIRLFVGKK